jgi:hypothetical protein
MRAVQNPDWVIAFFMENTSHLVQHGGLGRRLLRAATRKRDWRRKQLQARAQTQARLQAARAFA